MKELKQSHRSNKKANQIPRSATFNKKPTGMDANHTFSAASKK